MPEPPAGTQAFNHSLDGDETLLPVSWEDWLAMPPPYDDGGFSVTEVVERYARNGYEWICTALSTPPRGSATNNRRSWSSTAAAPTRR